MRKRTIQTTAALCMVFIFLTTACGSGQMEGQDESVVETIEKIQVEIAHDGSANDNEALLKIADEFNSSQDFYEAIVRPNSPQESGESSAQEYAAPITSSIVFTSDDAAASYAQDVRRMDLMPHLGSESGKDSLYSIIESLPAHMYETVCNEERGIFYLPVSVTPPVFFYNKTIYDELGLSLPKSYSELRDNCLSIYSKYRNPGYLPYDLEGDIMAMMREQGESMHSLTVDDNSSETAATETGQPATDVHPILTKGEVLQFFAGSCEAGYFRMVKHEAYAAMDFSTGAVASFAGTPADREMATTGVKFEVGMLPWIMDREDAVYWVDTSGMLFLDQGDRKNAGAAAFAAYLLRSDVCAEYLESVGGISPYASVYESQAYRKNRQGFDELTKAAWEKMPQADFVMLSNDKRRELDELLLFILDKKVTADDAVKIFETQQPSLFEKP